VVGSRRTCTTRHEHAVRCLSLSEHTRKQSLVFVRSRDEVESLLSWMRARERPAGFYPAKWGSPRPSFRRPTWARATNARIEEWDLSARLNALIPHGTAKAPTRIRDLLSRPGAHCPPWTR